jgi:hypothetical protein
MCACNKGGKALPRRFNNPAFRGTRGPDVRPPKGPLAEMQSPNPSARVTGVQPQPMNFERIRIEKLRRDAIIQAKQQNG